MELLILDTTFEPVDVLDTFESLIWVERYYGYGDFEIYEQVSKKVFDVLKSDYYLWLKGSDRVMIIEDRKIETDVENGNHLIVTGRSLESILDRRIIWEQTVLTGNLQNGIEKLLNENVISPIIEDRAIPNFIFEASDDPAITVLTVEAQFTRNNLYDAITKLCVERKIGFKITLSDSNQLVFKLFSGVNRSYDQLLNPYVVFSPKFENIINSNYSESKKKLKTITVVAGEGEGLDRKTTTVGGGVGFSRRELYTDARDLSQTVDEVLLPEAEYLAQLAQRGSEDLALCAADELFDSQADTTRMFKYGEHFFLGDIVQIVNEYEIESKVLVAELIHSQNMEGVDIYPTFVTIDE